MTSDAPRFLSRKELAATLQVGLSTVDRFIARNRIPAYYLGARTVRYKWADVEKCLSSCKN